MKTTRDLIIEAAVEQFKKYGPRNQEHAFRESLTFISGDLNLIAYAQTIGLDTDAILNPEHKQHAMTETCGTCAVSK